MFQNDTTHPMNPASPVTDPGPAKLTLQWGSGGESRIHEDECQAISDAVDRCRPGEYRTVFPVHGSWGALSLGIDGTTVWLYTSGGAFVAAELIDPATARPRGIPATGVVDVGKLAPDVQAAIAMLLRQAQAGRR